MNIPYKLDEDAINSVEKFVTIWHPIEEPSISDYYKANVNVSWNYINNNSIENTYVPFAENSYGMIEYGFYKSKKGIIYGIMSYCGSITNYFLISENSDLLKF